MWESRRAWITFWVWQNPPDSKGERLGEVVVHVLGQKCISCPNPNVSHHHLLSVAWRTTFIFYYYYFQSNPFIIGDLQGDEIDAVLSFLYMDIDYFFYYNENYTDLDEKSIEERQKKNKPPVYYYSRGVHRKESCQACREKVCTKKITAVYPVLPSGN